MRPTRGTIEQRSLKLFSPLANFPVYKAPESPYKGIIERRGDRQMAKTIFRAHVAGFTKTFGSLDEVRGWVKDLGGRHKISGETLKLHQGVRHGSGRDTCDVFEANCPYREITV